jgi:hypothetical protein
MSEESEEPQERPEPRSIPSKTDEELQKFVRDFIGGQIFCMQHVPSEQMDLVKEIFMVIGMGGLQGVEPASIGTIYEYLEHAGPRQVNGWPMFTSCQLMNRADWERSRTAINHEKERLDNLKV